MSAASVPVVINCRDLLAPLRQLVGWLERAGHDEIYLLDNDSAWEPLLDYYEQTPHRVVRLGRNYGKNALWVAPDAFELVRGRRFVYTDPDIVPTDACPLDAVARFSELLDRYRRVNKAGFGLRYDDIPSHYAHREAALSWETRLWSWPLEPGAYFAPHDTQFCLYRANAPRTPCDAIRTGAPYMARHTAYYLDFDHLTEEQAFHMSRAVQSTPDSPETAHWMFAKLPEFNRAQPVPKVSWHTRLRWRLRGRRAVLAPATWSLSG